jgi:adenylate cyclase
MPSTRRLAAILAADVAGYSRLMGVDEESTHKRVRAHFVELVHPAIEEHRGRVVKNTGDGLLAEFASVLDAVRCAVGVQEGMAEREPQIPEERRIRFRIGINLGDVIVEGDDIFGDGVNLAARLEALAEPGGICVDRVVHDQVRDKLGIAFDDIGDQQVKNIARPVRVFRISFGETPARASAVGSPEPAPAVLAQAPTVPRLSIVVLPFGSLSDDPEQEYFADALTEDLTTDLSRVGDLFVISRGSAFTYKGKVINAKQIGRELGVRYVLEGSVRRLGARIRINAQLIDAETAAHLWAERFDRDTSDLFALQDEITGRIAVELQLKLVTVEAAKPTDHPIARDYYLRGRAAGILPPSRDRYASVIGFFEQALALDPQSVAIRTGLAQYLTGRVMDAMSDAPAADLARARVLAEGALVASPRDPSAHYASAQVLRAQGSWNDAAAEYETCIAYDRNRVRAYANLGYCRLYAGAIDETIPLTLQAIRLSPRDPEIGDLYYRIGRVHLLQSCIDEAIVWLERARGAIPATPHCHSWLAAAYALAGNTERADDELAEARRLAVGDRFSSVALLKAAGPYATAPGNWGVPKTRALHEATFFAGLRKAGMPEE